MGSIETKMFDCIIGTLTYVRDASELNKKLVYLGALDFGGRKFTGQGWNIESFNGALLVMKVTKTWNLYKLDVIIDINDVMVKYKDKDKSTHLWHQWLGYMS